MLQRVYFDNFRCLEKFEFKPERVNLILGRNGSGKSTLFDALQCVVRLVTGESPATVLPLDTLPWWDLKRRQVFELEFGDEGGPPLFSYTLIIGRTDREPPIVVEERLMSGQRTLLSFKNGLLELAGVTKSIPFDGKRSAVGLGLGSDAGLVKFQTQVTSLLVFRVNPWSFDLSANSENRVLWTSGGNLVAFLRHWSQSDPAAFLDWKSRVLRSMPQVEDLQLREVTPGSRMLVASKQVDGLEMLMSLANLSDGERSLLALQAVAGFVSENDIVALDEPDNFLAPSEIQPVLRQFTVEPLHEPGPQLFVITHHPRSIDYLASYATWLFERDSTGTTRVRRHEFDRSEGERPADSLLVELSQ